MKAQELRLRNLVTDKSGAIHYVSNLSLDIDDEYNELIGATPLGKTSGEVLKEERGLYWEPIPLTEEWLKKEPDRIKQWKGNGHDYQPETSKTKQVFYQLSDDAYIVFQTWSWRPNDNDEWRHDHTIYIEYNHDMIPLYKNEVHVLQNLYFALTDEELTFAQ